MENVTPTILKIIRMRKLPIILGRVLFGIGIFFILGGMISDSGLFAYVGSRFVSGAWGMFFWSNRVV